MLSTVTIVPVTWSMPSNLKVNVYSISARFSLRHQACRIMRWRGELIKTAHDGFPVLFPRKKKKSLLYWITIRYCSSQFHLLWSKNMSSTVTSDQAHFFFFFILLKSDLMKIYGKCCLYEIIQVKNPINSTSLDKIHQIQAFMVPKNVSQKATYLHLFHPLLICCLCQQYLGSTRLFSALHLKCYDQYKSLPGFFCCCFVLLLQSRVLHITETKANQGQCCFQFPQFIKVHHTIISSHSLYNCILI